MCVLVDKRSSSIIVVLVGLAGLEDMKISSTMSIVVYTLYNSF
jgi:hypothetical protein